MRAIIHTIADLLIVAYLGTWLVKNLFFMMRKLFFKWVRKYSAETLVSSAERRNERVEAIKNELGLAQTPKKTPNNAAQVLHPGVYNIPHDEVKDNYDLDEIEYTK